MQSMTHGEGASGSLFEMQTFWVPKPNGAQSAFEQPGSSGADQSLRSSGQTVSDLSVRHSSEKRKNLPACLGRWQGCMAVMCVPEPGVPRYVGSRAPQAHGGDVLQGRMFSEAAFEPQVTG